MTLEMALDLASSSENRENIRSFARNCLAGRQGVLPSLSETSMNKGVFGLTRATPAIWRFQILSSEAAPVSWTG